MLCLLVSTVVFFYGGFRVQEVARVVTALQFSRWLPDFVKKQWLFCWPGSAACVSRSP